jgi:hypothetical protein
MLSGVGIFVHSHVYCAPVSAGVHHQRVVEGERVKGEGMISHGFVLFIL